MPLITSQSAGTATGSIILHLDALGPVHRGSRSASPEAVVKASAGLGGCKECRRRSRVVPPGVSCGLLAVALNCSAVHCVPGERSSVNLSAPGGAGMIRGLRMSIGKGKRRWRFIARAIISTVLIGACGTPAAGSTPSPATSNPAPSPSISAAPRPSASSSIDPLGRFTFRVTVVGALPGTSLLQIRIPIPGQGQDLFGLCGATTPVQCRDGETYTVDLAGLTGSQINAAVHYTLQRVDDAVSNPAVATVREGDTQPMVRQQTIVLAYSVT